ncbi:MAG: TlpA disulfide reductase family protein [Prosthecobacter sp.]|nr:TlpA disulfide reductase family protein [Prosthecobacter sp.]
MTCKHRIVSSLFLLGITGAICLPAAESGGSVAQSIRAVIDEYENNVRANTRKIIDAKTEAEKDKYRATVPTVAPYATKVLKIVHEHPGDADTARGVSWLVTQASGFPEGQEALKMLGTSHTASAGIAEAVKALEYHPLATAEPILLAVREKNPNANEKAAATYALGVQYFRMYESASALQAECCGNGPVAVAPPTGLPKQAEEAKAKAMDYFQEVVANYPGAAIQGFPLGDQASRMMFEMTNLAVGSQVPDIEGKDLDGNAFKLSDYRGKHVVLMFWGGWCHACHGVLPLMNQLTTDMKDKPVAVLGINTDIPEEARQAFQQYHVNFRNWSDGTTGGPITTLFNLRNFPTIYLIDPKGIIVLKNTSIDAVREKLKSVK